MARDGYQPDTGKVAEYKELSSSSDSPQWYEANGEEIGRIFQGLGPKSTMPEGTNTLFFIHPHQVPKHEKVTYIQVVCADRPEKLQVRRVRWTMGGNLIIYDGGISTKTANLTTVKCMLNSVISTEDGRFMTGDLKDFYLGTNLAEYEYARIPVHLILAHIIDLYDLNDNIVNGYIYAEARKGMYELPQVGKLTNNRLAKFLDPRGYVPCKHTHGLWRDTKSDLMFTLVVDDFGVRYTKKADATRLMDTLKLQYKVSEEWAGTRYIGLTLKWDYVRRTVELSMPGYVKRALSRFSHPSPTQPQDLPHPWTAPRYGSHAQYANDDESPLVDLHDTKRLQEVIGTFLYYARAVDSTPMLVALGTLSSSQAKPTKQTLIAMTQLLNYCATHPDTIIEFRASAMVLHVNSDASYLSESNGRSRFAGYHYLSDLPKNPTKAPHPDEPAPTHNGAIDVPCQIMDHVMSSEAEFGTLFHNSKAACPHRTCLRELGHP
jgi:hypothetical protein